MATLVLSVIGDDRSGLVRALSQTVTEQGGNWESSQLAELAGKFAGIVVVSVPDDGVAALRTALGPLQGLLDVTVHLAAAPTPEPTSGQVSIDLVANDAPGLVREVTGVLSRHGVSIDTMSTATGDAPWAGGRLFEAHIEAPSPSAQELTALRVELEQLAAELQVDITLDQA